RENAGERAPHDLPPPVPLPHDLDLLLARAVEHERSHRGGELREGRLRAEAVLRGERGEGRLEAGQRAQGRRGERRWQRLLGAHDDERRIQAALDPEPAARGAGAVRAVEGEEAWGVLV